MRFIVYVFILCSCFELHAQREVNVWYFGFGAGIDFNATPPIVLTDGKVKTMEGCASICDEYGKLLMYTDGSTAYNNKHQEMVNGTGLHGDASSAQAGMIIKLPKSDSIYLIFNPGEVLGNVKGFYYSVVNVYAKSGQGEVKSKNILLKANMLTEAVASVKHANGKDVWVVFRNDNSTEFVSYLVTPLGVSNTMTFSQPGPLIGAGSNTGYVRCSKFSASGRKYAVAVQHIGVCLYDFDDKTGYLSNLKILPLLDAYGVEFSPDETKLYATSVKGNPIRPYHGLHQYNISSNNLGNILASKYQLSKDGLLGALQLAPDRKIYFGRYYNDSLGVINAPNASQANCKMILDGLYLRGKKSGFGLPPFISSYFSDTIISSIKFTGKCLGDDFKFECSNLKSADSVVWDFGDTASGQKNFSQIQKPSHVYDTPGKYIVKAAIFRKNINNNFVPNGILDTFIVVSGYLGKANEYPLTFKKCIHDSVLVQAVSGGSGLSKVTWNDLPGNVLSRSIKYPGLYVATVYKTGSNCFYMDSTLVSNMNYVPKPDLGKDTMYCIPYGQAFTSSLGGQLSVTYQYIWNTSETSRIIQITKAGRYMVNAGAGNLCPSADTIDVSVEEFPYYKALSDTALCNDKTIKKLNLTAKGQESINWSTGETGDMVTITTSGKYWYAINNQCASLKDSFNVIFMDAPIVDLGKDLTVCSANGLELKSNVSGSSYYWSPGGEISETLFTFNTGLISLEVKNSAGCAGRDEIIVNDSCREECYVPNVFTPNTDGLNDVFIPHGNDIRQQGYVFRVYDRWGGILFETDKTNVGWNGMVENKPCMTGVYFYTVEFVTAKRKTIQIKGTFSLMN